MAVTGTDLSDIDLLNPDDFVAQKHHEWFRRLRAEAPVFWFEDGDDGFWNVVKHEDVVLVNRDSALFSSQMGGTQIFSRRRAAEMGLDADDQEAYGNNVRGVIMLEMDPPKHTRYRLLVNKGFTPRMIGLLEQALRTRATHIIDQVIEKGEADFVVDIASELPLQAIAEIMGVPQEDRVKLFEWSNRMIGAGDPEFMDDQSGNAMAELFMYSNQLAEKRRDDPRDDIVTKLLNAEIDGDKLSELEFDMFMLLLAVAGNETTRNATAHGMYALLQHPEQFEYLKEDPDGRMEIAIEEVLRWASPVLHFKRTTTADTEIRGTEIKEGDPVVMWYISANRDEDVFDDPYTFDVARDPNPQIAFGGGGNHFCLGANLARMELRLIFEEITRRIPDMQLATEPDRLRSNFIGGIKHMGVTYTPGKRVLSASTSL
jgi:cholest-4-en-3-one 26-monooxygenase